MKSLGFYHRIITSKEQTIKFDGTTAGLSRAVHFSSHPLRLPYETIFFLTTFVCHDGEVEETIFQQIRKEVKILHHFIVFLLSTSEPLTLNKSQFFEMSDGCCS